MEFIFYVLMFILGWFVGSRRMNKLQRDFTLLEHVIREAQESLISGSPVEAREYLQGVLPENARSHEHAHYVLKHNDAP